MNAQHPEFKEIMEPVQSLMDAFHKAFHSEFKSLLSLETAFENTITYPQGKYLRPLLFFLCQGLLGKPTIASIPTAVMIELVHTASLIHDDVIDESHRRRGEKTLNAMLGNHFSILIGDYLIARMMILSLDQKNGVMTHLSRAIIQMTEAELKQAVYEKHHDMEETTYFSIIQGKTGALFRTAAILAGHEVSASSDDIRHLQKFGQQFGMAFQIQDDILDYIGTVETLGKPVHQDVSVCFWTLPMILSIKDLSKKDQAHFHKQLTIKHLSRNILLDLVHNQHGIEKARSYLHTHSQRALEILNVFPESDCRFALTRLLEFNAGRAT